MVMRSAAAISGPGRSANSPSGKPGIIVHAVDLLDAETVHQAVLHHGPASAAALLRRLEDHDRGAGEIAGLGEVARGAQQHRGMAVVTAGMHLARHGGTVGNVVRLLDRQRVHVGAQPDHPSDARPSAAADHADHAGAADPGHHLVAAEALELVGHHRRGAVHVVEKLRMGVDVAPPGGDLAVEVGNAVDDRHSFAPRAARQPLPYRVSKIRSLGPI